MSLLGIRHHGPGSAASVERALAEIRPDCVLIEGPPEAEPILSFAPMPGMRTPLAILTYLKDSPERSRIYPLAEFSPEWRAILWAQRNARPAHFIDLPTEVVPERPAEDVQAAAETDDETETEAQANDEAPDDEDTGDESADARFDPLGQLAHAAGYADGESWWNALVEQHVHAPNVFAAIQRAMQALRGDDPSPFADDERREAHMRLRIRDALKAHEGAIAVVCGAWHTPALARSVPASVDRKTLRGLKKAKVDACWIPWTDQRLAAQSGYAAGVVSPGWYAHLWRQFNGDGASAMESIAHWQARAASLLREQGHHAATSSAIEATRLATALAALRGHPVPGLQEMRDASLAALCHGESALLSLIERKLVIGETLGQVAESAPQPPLLLDLARQQKRLRLAPKAEAIDTSVDLRTPTGMAKSELLHRLELIGVPWGTLLDGTAGRGTFKEVWRLQWAPELAVQLADAAIWGATIVEAAEGMASARIAESNDTESLAGLVRACLFANLHAAAERGISRLQAVAVNATDLRALMQSAGPLAEVLRYGTAREMPREALETLLRGLTVEVCVGLAYFCRNLNEEESLETANAIAAFDRSVRQLDDAALVEDWHRALAQVRTDGASAPRLAGQATRILYDHGIASLEQTANVLSQALSPAVETAAAGAWLEGFLGNSGDVLLHDDTLLACVDGWLTAQAEEHFIESLPMLRRAFSAFDGTLRQRLLQRVAAGVSAAPVADAAADDPRAAAAFEHARPLLETILGLAR